jgi:hypothetical protein
MHCNMQEGIKDGRRLRPGGLVFYRGPDARSHLKLQNIQASVNKDDCSGGRGGRGGGRTSLRYEKGAGVSKFS